MTQGGVSAGLFVILAGLYKLFNHHKIRGKCCGKSFDASVDIDSTDVSPTNATSLTALSSVTVVTPVNPVSASEHESKLADHEEKKTDSPV